VAYRLTRAAEEQIDALLLDSARRHSLEAAGRYGQLVLAVMAALGEEPHLVGSVEVPRLEGVRAYPTRLGRRRGEPGRRVANPRHLVVYRLAPDGVVEILGLIHDRMVLSRAAKRIVHITDQSRGG
jgi:toxin ParE1/3/4